MPPATVDAFCGHRFAMKAMTTMVATEVIHPSVRASAAHGGSTLESLMDASACVVVEKRQVGYLCEKKKRSRNAWEKNK